MFPNPLSVSRLNIEGSQSAIVTATLSRVTIDDVHEICETKKAVSLTTDAVSPPLKRCITWVKRNRWTIGIRYGVAPNSCCHNRYKKPFREGWFSFQPGLGLKREKSLVLNAPVDFTAAPKSWRGVIQLDKDCVRCG